MRFGLKKPAFVVFVSLFLSVFVLAAAALAGHGQTRPMKQGILLVAFGTSEKSAQVSFANIEKKVRAAYPKVPVRWAFTSHIIRKKLAKQGQILDSVPTALSKMMDAGITHVGVQSLHSIPGEEYEELKGSVRAFKDMPNGFSRILLGRPLMSLDQDIQKAVAVTLKVIPKAREKSEAVVLMGHGTHHAGNVYYPALQYYLAKKDPNIFVGTVEGSPGLDDVVAQLKAGKIKKAYLMPLMSVAGDHAKNDMAGDEPDSWKSMLEAKGISTVVVLKGTAEYDVFADLWVDHLRGVMGHFRE
ncbi:MAG: sirohydrochlorin cobaltochelatase [Thermodesulfobacteriota bacterium]|nr:sirohydrochlorin cobaltochelatase [Thermodesulfobacteriota bacterium]